LFEAPAPLDCFRPQRGGGGGGFPAGGGGGCESRRGGGGGVAPAFSVGEMKRPVTGTLCPFEYMHCVYAMS
jgi:hypothetical protein